METYDWEYAGCVRAARSVLAQATLDAQSDKKSTLRTDAKATPYEKLEARRFLRGDGDYDPFLKLWCTLAYGFGCYERFKRKARAMFPYEQDEELEQDEPQTYKTGRMLAERCRSLNLSYSAVYYAMVRYKLTPEQALDRIMRRENEKKRTNGHDRESTRNRQKPTKSRTRRS